jgi:hypothetical protein
MTTTTVITNNVPRDVLFGYDLTDRERAEFDYIDADEIGTHEFFRYLGEVYDLGEFTVAPSQSPISDWDGYLGDSFFSGVVVKYVEDCERVIVGTAIMANDLGASS